MIKIIRLGFGTERKNYSVLRNAKTKEVRQIFIGGKTELAHFHIFL